MKEITLEQVKRVSKESYDLANWLVVIVMIYSYEGLTYLQQHKDTIPLESAVYVLKAFSPFWLGLISSAFLVRSDIYERKANKMLSKQIKQRIYEQ
jgi:hypothetical protein